LERTEAPKKSFEELPTGRSVLGNKIGGSAKRASLAVRERRIELGLSQLHVARRLGIARQSLAAIEKGRAIPSVLLALRLAQILGSTVEELFGESPGESKSSFLWAGAKSPQALDPVALAWVQNRWVAHPLETAEAIAFPGLVCGWVSDAAGDRLRIRVSEGIESLEKGILIAGCAPALGWIVQRLNQLLPWQRSLWLDRPSLFSLEALAKGWIHVAGIHLLDEHSGEFNLPFVRRLLSSRPFVAVELLRWKAGLALAPGNPLGIQTLADAARSKARIVPREEGSGARMVLERQARKEGLELEAFRWGPLAKGHLEVAKEILRGTSDCGITIEPIARRMGLDFLPLCEERFDLVFSAELTEWEVIGFLLRLLKATSFRRELKQWFGYESSRAGEPLACPT
jgi:putative molybdopterin biosynthesis protein